MQFWNQLQGKSLAGTYPLNAVLRTEPGQAWFATRYRQKPATVFVAQAVEAQPGLLANLEAACRVRHPNIVSIERVGRTRIDGTSLVYAILEPTEENLAEALRERCLTTEETAQITESLVSALSALQENGLLHGRVNAANVFAAGETVKLRSDCIHKAPADAEEIAGAYGQDIGDLGALVFESLTQRPLTSPDDSTIAALPRPFRAIVQRAVSGRWGLTDISAALKKPSSGQRHPIPAPLKGEVVRPGQVAKQKSAPTPLEVRSTPTAIDQPRKKRSRILPFALLVPIAILAAIFAALYFHRGIEGTTPSPSAAAATGLAPIASPPTQAIPDQTLPDLTGEARNVWRVVVYAYTDESEARQKVDSILKTHPELNPEVFTANGVGPYLVTLGGRMDRADAVKLRSQIGGDGMPPDSYVQNYSH